MDIFDKIGQRWFIKIWLHIGSGVNVIIFFLCHLYSGQAR